MPPLRYTLIALLIGGLIGYFVPIPFSVALTIAMVIAFGIGWTTLGPSIAGLSFGLIAGILVVTAESSLWIVVVFAKMLNVSLY